MNRKFWLLYLLIVASVCVFVAGFEFNPWSPITIPEMNIPNSPTTENAMRLRLGYFGGDDA